MGGGRGGGGRQGVCVCQRQLLDAGQEGNLPPQPLPAPVVRRGPLATIAHAPRLFTNDNTRAQWWGSGRCGRGCTSAGASARVLDSAMSGHGHASELPGLRGVPSHPGRQARTAPSVQRSGHDKRTHQQACFLPSLLKLGWVSQDGCKGSTTAGGSGRLHHATHWFQCVQGNGR
jgi:hypothetical protein